MRVALPAILHVWNADVGIPTMRNSRRSIDRRSVSDTVQATVWLSFEIGSGCVHLRGIGQFRGRTDHGTRLVCRHYQLSRIAKRSSTSFFHVLHGLVFDFSDSVR